MAMNDREAVETLLNGNISEFKKWLKKARKLDMLDAIEYAQNHTTYTREQIINKMKIDLTEL